MTFKLSFKPKLVEDWKHAWKWLSVQCFVLIGAMETTWYSIPDSIKSNFPSQYVTIAGGVLAGLGVIARVLDQESSSTPTVSTQVAESLPPEIARKIPDNRSYGPEKITPPTE